MRKNHLCIIGIGIISPIGIGKEQFWTNLFKGVSGAKPITLFDTADFKVKVAGEISGFNPEEILGKKGLIDLDRASLMLMSTAKLALDDCGLEINEQNTHQTGVVIGTTFGSLYSISTFDRESLREGPRFVNPSLFPSTVKNSPASRLAIRFQIKGFNATISTGMCSALDALDYARDFIEMDRAQNILVGSLEDLSPQIFTGFYKVKYLSGSKDGRDSPLSCPFDKRRNGIIFSEGAVVLITVNSNVLQNSDAFVYGQVLGTGSVFDPSRFYRYHHKGRGMKEAMQAALKDADLSPSDIDCIFANANSTQDADAIETRAIKEVFKEYARHIPVSAVKSMVGESISNSGAVAVAAALGALNKGLIPATINYEYKDEECDLDYVCNCPRKKELSRVMINCFGFNGANTSVIIGKYKK